MNVLIIPGAGNYLDCCNFLVKKIVHDNPYAPAHNRSRSHKKSEKAYRKKLFALHVINKLRNLLDHRIVMIETDKHAVIGDPNGVQERSIVQPIKPGNILFRKKFPYLFRLGLLISRQQFGSPAWHRKKWVLNHI
jgi:hypothetical protein